MAEAELRKERADAPKGGSLGDASPRVHKALLEAEIAFGYPSGFWRVELLEQAARYLTWACSFAEAPWPSEVENLENEVREFRSGWNGYLTSISDQLQGITGLADWASAEEVTAVSKAGPLYQNQHRVNANDELLWIGGDKLVVQLALLKRSSELLSRTDVFRESQTALEALRAIFEQERIEVGLRSTIEGSARNSALVASNASSGTLPTATFQERNSESPLAKFPDSTLALLIFEQQLRVLPLDQKTAYANCVLFLSRRGEDADHAALRHFYQPESGVENTLGHARGILASGKEGVWAATANLTLKVAFTVSGLYRQRSTATPVR